ncbi:MAG: GTPase HflX [Acidimicrobiia bacterium]
MTSGPDGRRRRRLTATVTDLEVTRQLAYLVGVARDSGNIAEAEASLFELGLLAETAGSDPVGEALVRRSSPDPALFIGKGKVAELTSETNALDVDVVVFDNELSPAQQRNLQQMFECDVVDRVALILDIFAQHATSREGMLQVELAQHRYRLPRLRGKGVELSRLGGGIGTRGPGETQLETDRRRILERVRKLERMISDLANSRRTRTKTRRVSGIPMVALVGYTNAGKSSVFNRLTDAGVLVADRLFATLDSTVRRHELRGGTEILLSDTVGFVRRLPHQLVEAFRSTLEEVSDADLMLHVVDASDEHPDRQIDSVRSVLRDIGAGDITEILVVNKTDAASPAAVERLLSLHAGAVAVSAVTGAGFDQLGDATIAALTARSASLDLLIPYDRGDRLAELHRAGDILQEDHEDRGTRVVARVPADAVHRFQEFVVAAG